MKKFTFLFAAMLAAASSQAQVSYDNCNYSHQPLAVDVNGNFAQLSVDSFNQVAGAIGSETISSFYFLASGNTTMTYNCKDTARIAIIAVGSSGNRDTCYVSNIITIQDNFVPTARCQNISVTLDAATQSVTIAAIDLDNGSTDNCNLTYGIYNPTTTGSSPTKTYTAAGVYNETFKIFDISNNATCAATVTVLAPVAVTVQEANQTVRIMPNPFDNQLRLELGTAVQESQLLSLYSLDGRLVQQVEIPAGLQLFELNTIELPTGVYVLQLRNSAFQLSQRIIKQ